jgi:polyhydroxyalkanoate synthesis regulator protein
MARYLEQSLKLFMSQQQFLRGQVKRVVGVDPVTVVADMTQKNFARFRSLQEEVFQRFNSAAADSEEPDPPADDPAPKTRKSAKKRRKTG